jgi:hypothetical protein
MKAKIESTDQIVDIQAVGHPGKTVFQDRVQLYKATPLMSFLLDDGNRHTNAAGTNTVFKPAAIGVGAVPRGRISRMVQEP